MSEKIKPILSGEEAMAARGSVAFDYINPPAQFMWMPAGVNGIDASRGGKAWPTVFVEVKKGDEKIIQAALEAHVASGQKPFTDFEHKKEDASAWPKEFVWSDAPEPGIYMVPEWTELGAKSVAGKMHRGFSPGFFVDNYFAKAEKPARLTGAPLVMGGLTNTPAFKSNLPLWAKAAGAPSGDGQNQITEDQMKKTIAELQAAKNTLELQVKGLEAKQSRTEIENAQLEARQAQFHSAEQELKIAELEAKEVDRRTNDADAAVKRAITRNAIPAQNAELQAKWKTNCANNPDMIVVLDAINADGTALTAKQTPNGTSGVVVTGVGPKETAKAFLELNAANSKLQSMGEKIKQAKESYALYAKDIRGNKQFEDMPLDAATTADNIGTLAGTLVAQRTIELYKYEFPLLSSITSDYSDQPAQYNQTTSTRIITVPAIISYDATIDNATGRAKGWVIATQAVTTDVSITLNNHKGVEISFDSNTLGSTARRLFDEQAEASQYALGLDLVTALYALFTAANYPDNAAFTEAPVDFGRRTFAKCSRILNKQGVPRTNRFALVNSDYWEKLEQDPTLVSLAVFQKPEIITGSQLPQISRFLPIEAPNLPATGNMAAFFGHRSSAVIQARIPNDYTTVLGPAASYGQVNVVTNPDTGMSALLTQYVSHQGGYAAWRLAWMYGVAKAATKGGQIVKSA